MSKKNGKNTLADLDAFLKNQPVNEVKTSPADEVKTNPVADFIAQKPNTLVSTDSLQEMNAQIAAHRETSGQLSEQLFKTAQDKNMDWRVLWAEVMMKSTERYTTDLTREMLHFQQSWTKAWMDNYTRSVQTTWSLLNPATYVQMNLSLWKKFFPQTPDTSSKS